MKNLLLVAVIGIALAEGYCDKPTVYAASPPSARPAAVFDRVLSLPVPAATLADIRDTFSVLVNQEEQSRVVEQAARTVVDPAKVITRTAPKMGSEDFADMMQAIPGAYFWVGHDGSVPVHNPGYVLDDKILPIGASVFARIIETRLPAGSHA